VARFEVRPEQLDQAGLRAAELAREVQGLLAALAPVEGSAPLGLELERALGESLAELRSGLTALADALDQHGTTLALAANAYRGTDAAAARAARAADGSTP
jgi:hypothetical protein